MRYQQIIKMFLSLEKVINLEEGELAATVFMFCDILRTLMNIIVLFK